MPSLAHGDASLNTNENVIVSPSCASIVYRYWSMVRAEICAKDVPKLRMVVPTTAPHCDKHLHHDWPEVFSYSITRLFEIQTLQSLKSI